MPSRLPHQTSRGDPLSLLLLKALLLIAIAATAHAQDADRPADAVARTAALALAASDVPDDRQTSIPAAQIKYEPEGLFAEPRFIQRGLNFATRTLGDGGEVRSGFYPEFSNMVTGSGWISVGPGYRRWLFGDRAIVDASTAVSWRSYKMAQARFELTRLARSRVSLGSQLLWQDLTQVTYFGDGPASPDERRSEYRVKSTDVVSYATLRPQQWWAVGARFGWLQQPSLSSPAGTFKRGNPDALTTFANDVAVMLPNQPSYLHSDAFITADTRDSRSHPATGGVYRASLSNYYDRNTGTFSFQRYEAEAAQFVTLFDQLVVLAGHGWIVGTNTGAGHTVPFYLLPSLGGHNTIRAYTDFRFHDRNMLVVNAEARLALMTHLDVAAFADAGNVAPRVSGLNLDKTAYGLGLRMHTNRATFLRVDVAYGSDGWRFVFRTTDPLHLSRFSRRVAALPFVP